MHTCTRTHALARRASQRSVSGAGTGLAATAAAGGAGSSQPAVQRTPPARAPALCALPGGGAGRPRALGGREARTPPGAPGPAPAEPARRLLGLRSAPPGPPAEAWSSLRAADRAVPGSRFCGSGGSRREPAEPPRRRAARVGRWPGTMLFEWVAGWELDGPLFEPCPALVIAFVLVTSTMSRSDPVGPHLMPVAAPSSLPD
jgi:hypothetical protein